jgi:hypothetical protein
VFLLLPFTLAFRLALLLAMTLLLTVALMRNAIGGLVISALIAVGQHEQFITSLAAIHEEGSISAVFMALAQFAAG